MRTPGGVKFLPEETTGETIPSESGGNGSRITASPAQYGGQDFIRSDRAGSACPLSHFGGLKNASRELVMSWGDAQSLEQLAAA